MNTSWFVLDKYYLRDKMRRVRWVGLVARTGERKVAYRVSVGNLKYIYHV
jgi:hypothetical protein